MSVHNNLDTGTVCLQQADATVLSRRGRYFYFNMRAVKASQNKQTQVKLLLLFFCCSLSLALWENSTAPVRSREPPWGDAVPKDSTFWWSTQVYMESTYSIPHVESQPDHTCCTFQYFGKQHFKRMSGSFASIEMLAILWISCNYDSPFSGGVNFEQLHILTK